MLGSSPGETTLRKRVSMPIQVNHTFSDWITNSLKTVFPIFNYRLNTAANVTVLTDASPTGYGAFLFFSNGELRTIGGQFKYRVPVSTAARELLAFLITLKVCQHSLSSRQLTWITDSTAAAAAFNAGFSKSRELNNIVYTLQMFCFQHLMHINSTGIISSSNNLADPLSRGFPPPFVQGGGPLLLRSAAAPCPPIPDLNRHSCPCDVPLDPPILLSLTPP